MPPNQGTTDEDADPRTPWPLLSNVQETECWENTPEWNQRWIRYCFNDFQTSKLLTPILQEAIAR
jgi:hypothetical protein